MITNGMNGRKPMLATLADLLAPVSTSEFLEVFRARKRLHIAASDPTRAETLFSWRDIDTLLSEHALDENVRIMRDGVLVPRQLYTSNEGKRLNVRAFHDLLPQGVSIVVDYVHRSIPQIGQLSAAIEREMGIEHIRECLSELFQGRRVQAALGRHGRPGRAGSRKQAMARLEHGGAVSRRNS